MRVVWTGLVVVGRLVFFLVGLGRGSLVGRFGEWLVFGFGEERRGRVGR